MSRVTSRQRRANDCRRFWFEYDARAAEWAASWFAPDEQSMRQIYRDMKRSSRGRRVKKCVTIPCPPFREMTL